LGERVKESSDLGREERRQAVLALKKKVPAFIEQSEREKSGRGDIRTACKKRERRGNPRYGGIIRRN